MQIFRTNYAQITHKLSIFLHNYAEITQITQITQIMQFTQITQNGIQVA